MMWKDFKKFYYDFEEIYDSENGEFYDDSQYFAREMYNLYNNWIPSNSDGRKVYTFKQFICIAYELSMP